MATPTRNDVECDRDVEGQLPDNLEEDRLPKKARVEQVSNLDSSSFLASSGRKRTASSRSSAEALKKSSSPPPSPTSDDSKTSTPTPGKFKKSKRQRSSPHSHSEGLEYDDEDDIDEEEPPRLTPPAQNKHQASGLGEIGAEKLRKCGELKRKENITPPTIEKSISKEGELLETRQASTQSITSLEESQEINNLPNGPESHEEESERLITMTTPEEGAGGDVDRMIPTASLSSFDVASPLDSTRKFEELSEYMKETQVLAGLVVQKVNEMYKQAAEALMTTVSQSVPITQRIQEQLLRSRAEAPTPLVEEKESKQSAEEKESKQRAADPDSTVLRRSRRKRSAQTKSPRSESSSSPPSATASRQARSLSNSSRQSSEHRKSPQVVRKPPEAPRGTSQPTLPQSSISMPGRETPALATRPSIANFQVGRPFSTQQYTSQQLHPGSRGFLLPVPPQPQPLEYMFSPERGIWMPSDPRLTHPDLRRMSQLPYLPADYQQSIPFRPRGPGTRGPSQFPAGWMPYPRGDPRV